MTIRDLIKYELILDPNIYEELNYTTYCFRMNGYMYRISKNIKLDTEAQHSYGLYDSEITTVGGWESINSKNHLEDIYK